MKNLVQWFTSLFLFLLPWQTIWIVEENFLNGSKWQYGTLDLYATEILLWISIVLFMIWFVRQRKLLSKEKGWKFHWTQDRIFIFSLLLFCVYAFVSLFWAKQKSVAEEAALHIMEASLLFLLVFLGPLKWQSAVKWFIAGAVTQSALGIFQFATQSTFDFKWLGLVAHPVMEPGTSVVVGESIGRVLRAYGALSHPNVLGGFLTISLILSTIFIFEKGEAKQNVQQAKAYSHAKWYGLFVLQIAGLFFTFSRSAWIASSIWFFGIGLAWGFLKIRKRTLLQSKFRCIPGICLFVMGVFLVLNFHSWPIVETRFAHHSSHEIQSTEERVVGIQEALTLWKEHPLLGTSAGNFTFALFERNPSRPGYEYQPVHNVPLLLLTELGILGLVLLCLVIFSFWRFFRSQARSAVSRWVLLLGCLSWGALALFDHYLFSSYIGLMLSGLYFGILLRFIPTLSPSYPEEKAPY